MIKKDENLAQKTNPKLYIMAGEILNKIDLTDQTCQWGKDNVNLLKTF